MITSGRTLVMTGSKNGTTRTMSRVFWKFGPFINPNARISTTGPNPMVKV